MPASVPSTAPATTPALFPELPPPLRESSLREEDRSHTIGSSATWKCEWRYKRRAGGHNNRGRCLSRCCSARRCRQR